LVFPGGSPRASPAKLVAALKTLERVIEDLMFTTRIGKEFRHDQIELAMDSLAVSKMTGRARG
jgi:hypothetical protein